MLKSEGHGTGCKMVGGSVSTVFSPSRKTLVGIGDWDQVFGVTFGDKVRVGLNQSGQD